ncbi:hypothetical protein ACWC5I_23065 [Kitasatospora sp. NPDC001574]
MNQLIGWLLSHARILLATGPGRRARRPRRLSTIREFAVAAITPAVPAVRRPILPARPQCDPWEHRTHPGPLVRPYVDWHAWRAELDEMEREVQQRAVLTSATAGLPSAGHTYAYSLAGATA